MHDRGGIGGVIDAGEDRKVALFERGEKPRHGLGRRMAALDGDEPVLRHGTERQPFSLPSLHWGEGRKNQRVC